MVPITMIYVSSTTCLLCAYLFFLFNNKHEKARSVWLIFRTEQTRLMSRILYSTLQVYWNHCLLSHYACFTGSLCFLICLSVSPLLSLDVVIICLWVLFFCFVVSFGERVRARVSFWAAFVQYVWSDSPLLRTRITGLEPMTTDHRRNYHRVSDCCLSLWR